MNMKTGAKHAPESQLRNGKTGLGQFSPSNISIKYRLPLLIGAVLFGVVVASTWASYVGVKEAALEVGRERLLILTQQVANMLQESANNISSKTFTVANDPALRAYLRSPSSARDDAVRALQQFTTSDDPNSWRVEVWDINRARHLLLPEGAPEDLLDLDAEFKEASVSPFKTVGIFRQVKGVVTYPAVAAIKNEAGAPVGYLVRWRRLAATPNARQRLQELLGTKAGLYLGNKEGNMWTDLVNSTSRPPKDVRLNPDVFHYAREGQSPVIALARPISGTPWYVLIEFPDNAVLSPAYKSFRRMIIIGMVLVVIGLAAAWALSRSITRPLAALTRAATAITRGDDARLTEVGTNDELGSLATAFNAMVLKISSHQHELEQKVQKRTEQLQAANKELESFCYSVSHDLRAPLRAMNGFSRILCEEYETNLPGQAQRYLHLVRNNAVQMAQLIDDLLDFSRIGRQPLRRLRVAPADLVQQALDGLESEQEGRKVEISIGTLPEVEGDPSLLKVVYDNLLSNALKYTRKIDEAKIEIGAYGENGNRYPVFYVRDNGAGFDMKYANKLFGVFQRLHHAQEFEGTGVGLATTQRIIHRHGGSIWAEARVGAGATFFFTLGNRSQSDTNPATSGPLIIGPLNDALDRQVEA